MFKDSATKMVYITLLQIGKLSAIKQVGTLILSQGTQDNLLPTSISWQRTVVRDGVSEKRARLFTIN